MPSGKDEGRFAGQRQYPVVSDRAALEGTTPEARREQERAAIQAILERLPAEHRAEARGMLEGEGPAHGDVAFATSTDPEIARLLGVLTAIRQIDRGIKVSTAPVTVPVRVQPSLHVVIALVPELRTPDLRATVVRTPTDRGKPLLLLRESDLTQGDVDLGLQAAGISLRRYGVSPTKEIRMDLRAPRNPPARRGSTVHDHVAFLKSSPYHTIPGIGTVRSVEVVTDR
jgi:hypothetical protein